MVKWNPSRAMIKRRAVELSYASDASTLHSMLVYEFGRAAPVPKAEVLQAILDKRRADIERFRRNSDKTAALKAAA